MSERQQGRPRFGHVKVFGFEDATVDQASRAIEGYASTPKVDAYREVVEPVAFASTAASYLANPIVTWAHEWWEIPIGKTTRLEVQPAGLWTRIEFGHTARAEEVWGAVQEGLVRSLSIGFNGDYTSEWGHWETDEQGDVWHWTKLDLLEIAVVPLPANSEATFAVAKSLGLAPGHVRRVTPYANLPLADEGADWDGTASERRVREWAGGEDIDWTKYRKRFFWYDAEEPELFGSYKLPFADVIDGELRAVWRGCAAAMAALLGARGGVDIPDADRQPVYRHIVRYYERFEKEPPEFKGGWPTSLADVTFRADELDIYEEQVTRTNINRARTASEGVANIARKWQAGGGVPSAETVTALCTTARSIADSAAIITKASEVLSAQNREAITGAITSLSEVIARDAEAKARRVGGDEKDEKAAPAGLRIVRPVLRVRNTNTPRG